MAYLIYTSDQKVRESKKILSAALLLAYELSVHYGGSVNVAGQSESGTYELIVKVEAEG